MEMQSEVAESVSGRNEKVARGAALTDRDRQVVAYVAIARYLSTKQLHRLAFPGRSMPPCRRRLLRLAGLWKTAKPQAAKAGVQENFVPPYLRRREYRTFEGDIVEVWALTDAGYLLAERVLKTSLRVPRGDVSVEFLEHSIVLNDVLVGMLDPTIRPCPHCGRHAFKWVPKRKEEYVARCACGHLMPPFTRAEEMPFRWATSDSTRLPWTEYDQKLGRTAERIIQPDAVLEIGAKRLFLECETGSHSIAGNDAKQGATIAKALRYDKFITGFVKFHGPETFYSQAFPDGRPAELVFLVPSEVRKKNILAEFERLRRQGSRLQARVLSMSDAPAAMLGLAGPRPTQPPAVRAELTVDEVRALQSFYASVVMPVKRARAEARAGGTAVPEYPPGTDVAGRLIKRLHDELAANPKHAEPAKH